jgi:hypothetical protein
MNPATNKLRLYFRRPSSKNADAIQWKTEPQTPAPNTNKVQYQKTSKYIGPPAQNLTL